MGFKILMRYIINNEILYESEGLLLWNQSSPDEPVRLSETTGRLFVRLLSEPNKDILRDIIIHDVWDQFGYTGTGNSLNQYISLLRRKLSLVGSGDIIHTVPKVGFSLQAIVELDRETTDSFSNKAPLNYKDNTSVVHSYRWFRLTAASLGLLIILVSVGLSLMITTGFSMLFFSDPAPNLISESNLYELGMIDSCPIYTVSSFSKEYQQHELDQAIVLTKKGLPCVKGAFYILDIEDLFLFNSGGRAFITRCTFDKNETDTLSECKDVYVSNQ